MNTILHDLMNCETESQINAIIWDYNPYFQRYRFLRVAARKAKKRIGLIRDEKRKSYQYQLN